MAVGAIIGAAVAINDCCIKRRDNKLADYYNSASPQGKELHSNQCTLNSIKKKKNATLV